MRKISFISAFALLATLLSAQSYVYYTDSFSNPSLPNWTQFGSTMEVYNYTTGGYSGAEPVPGFIDNSQMLYLGTSGNGGEVKMTIRLDPTYTQGDFFAYLCAASDLSTYYKFQLHWVTGTTGTLTISKAWADPVYGTISTATLGSATVTMTDGMTFRAIVNSVYIPSSVQTAYIYAYTDSTMAASIVDNSNALASGYNGFGVANTAYNNGTTIVATGNLVSSVSLGNITTTPPSGIVGFTDSPAPTYVILSWSATSDPGGPGVWAYQLYRGSTLLTTTSSFSYTDSVGLVPDTTYSYTLVALDFFQNPISYTQSFTTANTPTDPPFPSATPDGRRVGVRSTGAYWGASNENLDVFSGNINFALPLLNPQGRGGWSVPFKLEYNSQNWGYNTSTALTSLFDKDVGYGFGWRLLAGAIIPVWNGSGMTALYYLFIDSTGAEYRLDQNSGNTWYSKDSIYVYFDANAGALHFRDGSV